MDKERYRQLGDLLVEKRLITPEQLAQAIETQKTVNMTVGEILEQMGLLTGEQITEILAEQWQIPLVDRARLLEADTEVVKLLPETLARRHCVLPILIRDKTLTLAISNPLDVVAIDDVRRVTGLQVITVLGQMKDIMEAITIKYSSIADLVAMEEMMRQFLEMKIELEKKEALEEEIDPNQLKIQADDPPVVKLVNHIIAQAISQRASDIHIEPYEDKVAVRCRVDGVLFELLSPPKQMQMPLISRVKIMSNLDIAERRLPQDGSFTIHMDRQEIDFRVSTLPTLYGEKVVMRLLAKEAISRGDFTLENLGFEREQLEIFKKYISRPYGMILMTGPTGSGKTTTLYTVLNTIKSLTKNIVTVEDPVEYRLEGVQQVHARPDIGLTFSHALRSILRQDPDIIMVGEIRDLETAQMAVRSALTGHLVFSTLHTNDAVGAVTRLINIGIEPFLVTASVSLSIAQRLVRKICTACKEAYKPAREVLMGLGLEGEDILFYRGHGCKECRKTGYSGRIAIYEIFELTPEIREMILNKAREGQIRKRAIEKSMVALRQSGIYKVLAGITTAEECLNVTIEEEV